MQPTIVVRYVGLLLALLGIVMLIWRTASSGSGSGYDTVRLIHIIVALALIGLLEAALARRKREGTINAGPGDHRAPDWHLPAAFAVPELGYRRHLQHRGLFSRRLWYSGGGDCRVAFLRALPFVQIELKPGFEPVKGGLATKNT